MPGIFKSQVSSFKFQAARVKELELDHMGLETCGLCLFYSLTNAFPNTPWFSEIRNVVPLPGALRFTKILPP